jgi:hypothetical protein
MKTKQTARRATEKRLERVLSDLDAIAVYFEQRGFGTQRDRLDAAADRVEDVRDTLASLR